MKTTRLFCIAITIFLLVSFTASAQNWLKLIPNNSIKNKKPLSLFTIEKAFNEYWGPKNVKNGYYMVNGKKTVAAGWKLFKEWEWYWKKRVNPVTGEFPNTNALTELKKSYNSLKKSTAMLAPANWTSLGPSTAPGNGGGLGRINCIAFDPSDANTYWVGSPSGGIWETTDNGLHWKILNNNQTVLGVSDIAIPADFSTSKTIYIATGDRDGGSLWSIGTGHNDDNESIGILKSTDGGSTWNSTGLSFTPSQGMIISRLLIDPNNVNVLYVATKNGIYKSIDGGTNWGSNSPNFDDGNPFPSSAGTYVIDMEFKPGDSQTIYASTKDYYNAPVILRTTDGGSTAWTTQKIFTFSDYRVQLAVTANNPQYVYAVVCDQNSALSGIYKSTDGANSFSMVYNGETANHNLLGYNYDASDTGQGQGDYDLCLAASPANSNLLFLGGVNTWESTDGGSTWQINNFWTNSGNLKPVPVVHADQHILAFQNNNNLFEGNDGGIYYTSDGGTNWIEKTSGLVISQIYRISVDQIDPSVELAGLQDNGSKLLFGGTWYDVTGGDGTQCIIDYSNDNNMYSSYVQGQIYYSSDQFVKNVTTISANIPGGQPKGAWVTPFIIDKNNPQTLYAGYDKVYKTTDRGTTWQDISSGGFSGGTNLNSLAISPSNSNYIYASDFAQIWKTTDGGASGWTEITGTLPVTSASITNITVSANDPNTLWVTFGGYSAGNKVFQSTNGGADWTNISGVLPNIPVMCIAQNKRITSHYQLFIGTDAGVFAKDGSNDWITFSTDLPNVIITDLKFYYDAANSSNDRLRAGSFGRGMWETPVVQPVPVELTTFNAAVSGSKVTLHWETATETNNSGFEIERSLAPTSSQTLPTGTQEEGTSEMNWKGIGFVKGAGNSTTPKEYSYIDNSISSGSSIQYRLKQIDYDGTYKYSKVVTVSIVPDKLALSQNYPNPFNPETVIQYEVPKKSKILLNVYDIIGNKVTTLVNEIKSAGVYSVQFNGDNLASGVYFYKLTANNNSIIKKMILLK